jgi:hypothetical protein
LFGLPLNFIMFVSDFFKKLLYFSLLSKLGDFNLHGSYFLVMVSDLVHI